ncbi:MAG: iron-containing redox enzyme family protein [Pseudomonadota bacterium]
MSDFYDVLIQSTESQRQQLEQIETLQKGARGEVSLKTYQAFLIQAYHHVKHTTPLLMACGSRIPAEKEWLRDAIAEYIEEELGHQEWILNDLKATGIDAEIIRYGQAAIATELMVAYAYDTINRNNPVSFFGMVLVLEGTSIALATTAAEKTQQALNLPDSAFSYLTSHGSLDIEHMGFYKKLMNQVKDPKDQQDIIHAAKVFYQLYGDIFRALPV